MVKNCIIWISTLKLWLDVTLGVMKLSRRE